jgi:CRP-like cAMP-binding protein
MASVAEALHLNPWFNALEQRHFDTLVSVASERSWPAGQIVFREGVVDDHLYFILDGQIALEIYVPTRGRVTILTIGPNEIFGWSAVVPVVQKRVASARAIHPTRGIAFDGPALRKACDDDHDLGYFFYRRLTNVIAGRLTATRLQLIDMYAVGQKE